MEYNGILNVYKPENYTSRDIVNIVSKIYSTKKVGHAGTLDPNATGVLPICIGKATKLVDYIQDFGKTYVGELSLEYKSDTLDMWGNGVECKKCKCNLDDFDSIINSVSNSTIIQTPPMFSAVKVNGKRLYDLARKGEYVERKGREVNIYNIDILNKYSNKIRLKVSCSKGTYIRVLFEDIASQLDELSYMSSLCRVSYGEFNISNSYDINYLKKLDSKKLASILYKIEDVYKYESINFEKKYFKHISNGLRKKFKIDKVGKFKIYCDNIFIGIGELIPDEDYKILKMERIFVG